MLRGLSGLRRLSLAYVGINDADLAVIPKVIGNAAMQPKAHALACSYASDAHLLCTCMHAIRCVAPDQLLLLLLQPSPGEGVVFAAGFRQLTVSVKETLLCACTCAPALPSLHASCLSSVWQVMCAGMPWADNPGGFKAEFQPVGMWSVVSSRCGEPGRADATPTN